MKVWMRRNTIYRKIMCPVKFCSSKPVWKFMSGSWFRNGGSFFCWSTVLSAFWSNVYCPAIVCHIIRLFATGGYAEHNAGKITENYIRLSFRHSFTFSPIQYIVFGQQPLFRGWYQVPLIIHRNVSEMYQDKIEKHSHNEIQQQVDSFVEEHKDSNGRSVVYTGNEPGGPACTFD